MMQQFIHATQSLTRRGGRSTRAASRHRFGESHVVSRIDELVMVRMKGERSEREDSATGRASTMRASRIRAHPQRVSTKQTSGGNGWLLRSPGAIANQNNAWES